MHKVSRPVAEKLKEAGYPQEPKSLPSFYFNIRDGSLVRVDSKHGFDTKGRFIKAPDLGELIRELPINYSITRYENDTTGKETFVVENVIDLKIGTIAEADTPEDAAAEAWLELQKAQKD
jgi:hypothetical protein